MPAQRLRRILVATAVAALICGTMTTPAVAAPPSTTYERGSRTISGDLTGDGIADRLTLGEITKASGVVCAYQLTPGLGHGAYGTPVTHTLPVAGTVEPGDTPFCPDLGVVVKGPTAAQNQLAVAWFEFDPIDAPTVQTFQGFGSNAVRNTGGFYGEFQPSGISSEDFDGDGWGDLWEATDQGDGFTAYVGNHGRQWHTLYQTPPAGGASSQFFDFNHNSGIDILVTWFILDSTSGAAVVDGKTGAVQVLASTGIDAPSSFQASVVDVDHNNYPDIQVIESTFDGQTLVHTFDNQSRGGRWYFRPIA